METLSFNELPGAVAQLFDKLTDIEQLLREQRQTPQQPESDLFFDTEQAGKFLNLTVPTIYGLVHRKKINYFKQGKQLRFLKKDLTEWILSGRKQTQKELDLETDLHLMKIKKGGIK